MCILLYEKGGTYDAFWEEHEQSIVSCFISSDAFQLISFYVDSDSESSRDRHAECHRRNAPEQGRGEKTSVSKPSDLEAGSAIQFDFGTTTTAGSPFITIKGSSAYSVSTGYGWTTGTAIEKNGGVNTSKAPGWLDETPDSTLKTACQDFVGAKAGTDIGFQVDVPNGTYTVTVYAGENTNGWAEETVSVNGEELGRTKKVTTGSVPTGYATSIDEEAFKHVKQIVTEGNKGITLNIKSSKTNSRAYVNAMVITCDELAASETYSIRYNANGASGTVPSDKTGLDSNNEVSLEKNPAITIEDMLEVAG